MRFTLLLLLLFSSKAWGLFDTILNATEKVAEASALVNATYELLKTAGPDSSSEVLKSSQEQLEKLNLKLKQYATQANRAHLTQWEMNDLLKGPQLSHQSLSQSIRNSNEYIKRVKRLLTLLAKFPRASSAYSQAETVLTLQEVLKIERAHLAINTDLLNTLNLEIKRKEIEDQSLNHLIDSEFHKRRGL